MLHKVFGSKVQTGRFFRMPMFILAFSALSACSDTKDMGMMVGGPCKYLEVPLNAKVDRIDQDMVVLVPVTMNANAHAALDGSSEFLVPLTRFAQYSHAANMESGVTKGQVWPVKVSRIFRGSCTPVIVELKAGPLDKF